MGINDLIAELDAIFGSVEQEKAIRPAEGPKPKFDPPVQKKSIEPPPLPEYWQPVAVVLCEPRWQCRCGNSGHGVPFIAVRERKGRRTRLRAIARSSQYAHLPREREVCEATQVNDCPACFSPTMFGDPQLTFPEFTEPLAPYIESGLRAADFAEALLSEWRYNPKNLSPELQELGFFLDINGGIQ